MAGDNLIEPEIARAVRGNEHENEGIRQEAQGRVENNRVENREGMPNVQEGGGPHQEGYNQSPYGYAQGGSSYPNGRKHENFSYSNPKAVVQFPPGFDPGAKLPTHEGKATNEDALALILRKMDGIEENRKIMAQHYKNLEAQQKVMEFQMGQLATTVGHMQNKGKFSSTTESNPKEHGKAIELRSGMRYQGPPLPNEHDEEKKKDEIEQENEDDKVSEKDEDEEIASSYEDEEKKGMMKNDKEEMKKKQKKDESAQQVPKWKLAKGLKEKRSDEVECDEWGIPKIQDRVPFPQRESLVLMLTLRRMIKVEHNDGVSRCMEKRRCRCKGEVPYPAPNLDLHNKV
ncbi:hypothetical protein ACS0TY_031554 [Phlomoides rotata]